MVLGLAALIVAVVPALAATRRAPSRTSVTAVHRPDLPPNRELGQTDELRWLRATTRIKSGGRLTLKNLTRAQAPGIPNEVHNFSIVRSSQVPRTEMESLVCGSSGICRTLNDKHRFDPNTGQPAIAVVNRGRRGIDRTGDSIAFSGTRRTVVSARPGRTLRFICAVHPHMQGKIVVGR
jgi:hypothetical protein